MAGSPEAQRRQKWIERRVRQLLEEQDPGLHQRLRVVAEQEWAEGPGRIEASATRATDGVEALRRALQDP
jgi:hypothetical protein